MRLFAWLTKSGKKSKQKLVLLLMIISSLSLTVGCAHPHPPTANPISFCEVFTPLYFNEEATITWLVANDKQFIKDHLAGMTVLGYMSYADDTVKADLDGRSPFDASPVAVEEAGKIKASLDQLLKQ